MRLLQLDSKGEIVLTKNLVEPFPAYAILSHTWGADDDESTLTDLQKGTGRDKPGFKKIKFCGDQARKDGISYFWVDTCCIDKTNHVEFSEAIISMFRWYREAKKCYVYLSDVSGDHSSDRDQNGTNWESEFCKSRWFERGWTLQELLAPAVVEFYSQNGEFLGDKTTLIQLIHTITSIPIMALNGTALSHFPTAEKMRWAAGRETKRLEDKAYCLQGIFDVFMLPMYGEKDNAVVRLQAEIVQRHGSAMGSTHKHWLVPRPAQPLFTGREALLQELESIIRRSIYTKHPGAPSRIVVYGMGGQGKSELCLQLAYRLRYTFWAVLWIDISTKELAERSFLEVARALSLPAQTWQEARSGISSLKHPWLLILDNADDPEVDYLDYFPDSAIGIVMMTTRNYECQQYATARTLHLQEMDNDDACELLLKACRVSSDRYEQRHGEARAVAGLLQSHALALIQAGAYIAHGHCDLATYPQIYHQQRRRLMKFRPRQARSRYQDVYTTFEVSANALQSMQTETARDALQLLPLLAVCETNRFPVSFLFEAAQQSVKKVLDKSEHDFIHEYGPLVTSWHVTRLPSLIDAADNSNSLYRLTEAMYLLKAFSLITINDSNNSSLLLVSLHPLVHAWVRDRQDNLDQHQSWIQVACLVAVALYSNRSTPLMKRELQAHVEALIEWPVDAIFATELPMPVTLVVAVFGWYLLRQRAEARSYKLLQQVAIHLRLDWCNVDRTYIELYMVMGSTLTSQGQGQAAVSLLKQVLAVSDESLAGCPPDRLSIRHELARAYSVNRQIEEAIALLQSVLVIQKSILAEDNPHRLASQHELALAYHENGQIEEAVALLEKVVEIMEKSFAEDNRSRLVSKWNLAIYLWKTGQRERPIAMMREVVQVSRQMFDEDDPDRQLFERLLDQYERATGTAQLE